MEQFEKLYQLQEEYNRHTNITSINSKEDFYLKHIEDSLALLEFLPEKGKLIDVGSGGGYPGLPIAIKKPNLSITLNDSIQKKTRYLESVVQKLGLSNVDVVCARAETLGQNSLYRETFDFATARAVAETRILLELLAPLVKVEGILLIMKARSAEQEISAAENAKRILGLKLQEIKKYMLKDNERSVIIYRKITKTPLEYPRKPGIPEKRPL